MLFQPIQYFLSTFEMEAEIAFCPAPEFLCEVETAVLTVGMWENMENIDACNVSQRSTYFIESTSEFCFPEKDMWAAGGTKHRFVEQFSM